MLIWRLLIPVLALAAFAVIALPGGRTPGPEPEVADAERASGRDARPGEVVVPDQYIVTFNRSAEAPPRRPRPASGGRASTPTTSTGVRSRASPPSCPSGRSIASKPIPRWPR